MDELLQQALNDYRIKTGLEFDPSWQPRSADDLARRIRTSSAEFESWRSRHAALWRTLSTCVRPIISVASIASGPSTNVVPGAGVAIGGIVAIIKACEGVSEAYDYVQDMFAKLEDIFSRWNIDAKHEIDPALKQKMQKTMVIILAILSRSQSLIHGSRMKQYFRTLAFGKDEKVQDLVRQLEAILQEESRTRSALTLERVNSIWQTVTEEHHHNDEKKTLSLLESPAVEFTNATFEEKEKLLLENTGKWFQDEPLYQHWTNNKRRVLLTMGGPGAGKSFLATSLIKELKKRYPPLEKLAEPVAVAFFYLDKNSDASTMLKTMAYQLQLGNSEFRSHIIATLTERTLHTPERIWEKIFVNFWNVSTAKGRAILIFDGLDEVKTDERPSIVDLIRQTMESSESTIQIAVFGRLTLRYDLDFIPTGAYVEVSSAKNKKDISAYIDRGMAKVKALKRSNATTKESYRQRILERSDGVFEWARLFLVKIQNKEKAQINAILENPPKDLDAMIESCFDEIQMDEDIDPITLKLLLTWSTYAKRTLCFIELYQVVKLLTGEQHELLWLTIVGKLASIFKSKTARLKETDDENAEEDAIEIMDETLGWSDSVQEALVSFCHKRIQDYVVYKGTQQVAEKGEHHFPDLEVISHLQMLKACFRILENADTTKWSNLYHFDYPVRFFHLHLETLDINSLSLSDLNDIVHGIIYLFYNPEGCKKLLEISADDKPAIDSFWTVWIASPNHIRIVQTYLRRVENPSDDENVNKWVREGSLSIKEFVRPIAMTASRYWLTQVFEAKPVNDYDRYWDFRGTIVRFLIGFVSMTEDGLLGHKLATWTTWDLWNVRTELDEIMLAAEWSHLPQDAVWNTCLALELNAHGWYVECIKALKTALSLDDHGWMAYWTLSLCSASYIQDYDEAFRLADKAKELCPQSSGFMDQASARWYIAKRDSEAAVRLAAQAYSAEPENCTVQGRYLWLCAVYGHIGELMEVLRSLQSRRLINTHGREIRLETYNQLTGLLLCYPDTFAPLGVGLRMTESEEDRSFILKAIDDGLKTINEYEGEEDQLYFKFDLALWYRNHRYEHPDQAIELMKSVLKRATTSELLTDPESKLVMQVELTCSLSKLLYEKARLQHAVSDPGLDATLRDLKNLTKDMKGVHLPLATGYIDRCMMYPDLIYGRWLREHGDGEEDWRDIIRPRLVEHMSMLDDLDPQNDFHGITHTATALFHAGDSLNASALLAAYVLRAAATHTVGVSRATTLVGSSITEEPLDILEEAMTQVTLHGGGGSGAAAHIPERSASLRLKVNENVTLTCSSCTINVKNAKAMYWCEICISLIFCDECLPELKAYPIFGKACHAGHRRCQVWPIQDEVKDLAVVQDGDDVWLKQEWLDNLKRKWDLT